MSARLGLAGWPAVAEEAIIARDCLLAAHVGSALHVCHVSTAGSAEIIRWAKSKGWPVTAEVTPHHLLLTDELAAGYDPVFKVNRARQARTAARARPPAATGRARSPHPVRPGGARRGGHAGRGVQEPEHALRRDGAAGPGGRYLPARRPGRARRKAGLNHDTPRLARPGGDRKSTRL